MLRPVCVIAMFLFIALPHPVAGQMSDVERLKEFCAELPQSALCEGVATQTDRRDPHWIVLCHQWAEARLDIAACSSNTTPVPADRIVAIKQAVEALTAKKAERERRRERREREVMEQAKRRYAEIDRLGYHDVTPDSKAEVDREVKKVLAEMPILAELDTDFASEHRDFLARVELRAQQRIDLAREQPWGWWKAHQWLKQQQELRIKESVTKARRAMDEAVPKLKEWIKELDKELRGKELQQRRGI